MNRTEAIQEIRRAFPVYAQATEEEIEQAFEFDTDTEHTHPNARTREAAATLRKL